MKGPHATTVAGTVEPNQESFLDGIRRFFFEPRAAHTLAVMRICTGAMIAYVHWVWMLDLESFLGPHALIDNASWRALHQGEVADYKWTYLAFTEAMPVLWAHEILACLSGVVLCTGFCTRTFSVLAWFTTLMTAHRMTGMLFGLDQIVLMVSMFLCLGKPGNAWSVDRWLIQKFPSGTFQSRWFAFLSGSSQCGSSLFGTANGDHSESRCNPNAPACWSNTFATRLIQLQLCVIYLFGGLGKLRGEMWWDGSAMWYSIASYEYQSMDMTWTGHFAILSSIVTHLTLFWEVSYSALVWPRWTRACTLAIAMFVHGGIALFLGMMTFGGMMIVANLAFVSPERIARLVGALSRDRRD